MGTGQGLALALALLAGNAFFVGAEFAVISARRSQVEPAAQAGDAAARRTLRAMERVTLMLACAQLGITVCSLGLGAVAEPALAHLLAVPLSALGLPEPLQHAVAFAVALALVVALHVVVGEMVPKNLALARPERTALVLAPALLGVATVFSPVVRALNGLANGVLRLAGVRPRDEVRSAYTLEEVASIVQESRGQGLSEHDHERLTGALELGARSAGDVMVAWDALVAVPTGATPATVDALVARTGFSRFPVITFGEGAHSPGLVGYLHLKDVLHLEDDQYEQPIPPALVRPLVAVAIDEDLDDALATMRASGTHLARVVDAAAATAGVLFLEDVLEELVGEVRDATQRSDRGDR